MNILINASNQKGYGGGQVTDSLCRNLSSYPQHKFVVVLNPCLGYLKDAISVYDNVTVELYGLNNSLKTLCWGRDYFLDKLIVRYNIEAVLSVFGPTRWNPKVPHLAGFALSQLVIPESPFYQIMTKKQALRQWVRNATWLHFFKQGTKFLYTENPFITERVKKKWPNREVITVTNYYNQLFDNPDLWKKFDLPKFDGTTILTLSRNDVHKHITILPRICNVLKTKHPYFKFRFIIPEEEVNFPIPSDLRDNFVFTVVVPIQSCPSLYSQCDIAFQPTLLECFTATYPEAMRMELPLITCNLDFARKLCGEGAVFFEWDDENQAADTIYEIATDKKLANKMISAGKKQLLHFDNYEQRTRKLIEAIERLASTGTLYENFAK